MHKLKQIINSIQYRINPAVSFSSETCPGHSLRIRSCHFQNCRFSVFSYQFRHRVNKTTSVFRSLPKQKGESISKQHTFEEISGGFLNNNMQISWHHYSNLKASQNVCIKLFISALSFSCTKVRLFLIFSSILFHPVII